jgi:hypothetical protein
MAQSNQEAELPTRIDSPLDRRRLGEMSVDKFAGLTFRDYREAMDFAKVITHAKFGLPAFLRNNAPDCLIITTQALRWRLEPVWVMQNAYVTKADGVIGYDNFVFGAVLMASGVLKGRPRYTYSGEGDARVCTISATFKGETEQHNYSTPPLKQCKKNSPLWIADPDQQLGYFAIRSFARRYIPELLGGVYARDEFEDFGRPAVQAASSPRPTSIRDVLDQLSVPSADDDGLGDEDTTDQGEYTPEDDEFPPDREQKHG